MDETTIERIARAICRADSPGTSYELREECWRGYVSHARAVLMAVREPTEATIHAAEKKGRGMSDLDELIARLEAATEGSRELDAEIVARLNNAIVKPYPPPTDFGPSNRWQFWSEDGKHYLGNEGNKKFAVSHYTTSIDAALTLVPEGMVWDVTSTGSSWVVDTDRMPCGEQWEAAHIATPALALCIAALKARKGNENAKI